MNSLEMHAFIATRLKEARLTTTRHREKLSDDTEELEFEPIKCQTFRELCDHYFGDKALEYTEEIEYTLAMMLAVVLSTTATGGQLALRVMGDPGTAKSTLAESISAAKSMVHAMSKFTGIVSGWASVRQSRMTASKINGKTLLIKDADPLIQLPNIKQIESELRDALGDGVIRAEYRTGRSFEINTLFTLIMCGTPILRRLDDSELGARYLDISIHDPRKPTDAIVSRAIDSQFSTICSQLSGGIGEMEQDTIRRKEIIRRLAPPTMGFLQHKREQIRKGIKLVPWSDQDKAMIHAMGNLVSYLRAKSPKQSDGERKIKPRREVATRLGEQLTRTRIYLSVVLGADNRPIAATKRVDNILRRVVKDSTESYQRDVLEFLHSNGGLESRDCITARLKIGSTSTYNLLQDMVDLKILSTQEKVNGTGHRGRNLVFYSITPELNDICGKAGLE